MASIFSIARRGTSLLGALLLSWTLVACAVGPDGTNDEQDLSGVGKVVRPVQMNDVSVLLPLVGKSQSEVDASYLSFSSHPAGDPSSVLLPEPLFDMANAETEGFRGAPPYESMRLVALRLDPCFANIGPIVHPASCQNQLRLVFQSVTVDGKHATAADGAFHVFYSLSRTELVSALNDITALRIANSQGEDLGPLAVHPIVKSQGMNGAMAKGLNAIVLKYASAKKVVKVTSFHGIFAQGTSWLFDVVDVKNGKGTLSNVATMTPAGTVESLRLGTAPEGLLSLQMASSSSADGNHLLLDPVAQESATDADRQEAYDAALRVENPSFHSPNTIDCTTCHTAQISRQLIGEQFFKLSSEGNPNLFVADASIPVADLALTVPVKQPQGLSLNLHAFSYDATDPTIIARVVNESASIVAYVNKSLVKKPAH